MGNESKKIHAKLLEMARNDLRRSKFSSALRRYTRLTGLDPDNPTYHLKVADLSLRIGKKREAAEAYLRVAALFARDAFDDKAVSVYKQAYKIDPNRHEICALLAETYQRLGRMGEAMTSLRIAAQKCQLEGNDEEALLYRRKLAALDPDNTKTRAKLARDFEDAGRGEDSLEQYLELALALARQRKPEQIPAVMNTMRRLKPAEIARLDELTAELEERPIELARPLNASMSAQEVEQHPNSTDELLSTVCRCQTYQQTLERLYRQVAQIYRESLQKDEPDIL